MLVRLLGNILIESISVFLLKYIKSFIRECWLKRYGSSPSEEIITLMWSFVVSIYSIGGLLGSLSAGYLSVRFGRKKVMLLNNIPALLSAALMGLSRLSGSFEMIIIGRLLAGVCGGLGLNIHIMYAGECAPQKLRGVIAITLHSDVQLFLLCWSGFREVLGVDALWPILMAANALPALVQLLTLPFFPDSPRYLLIDKKDKEGCIKGKEMGHKAFILAKRKIWENPTDAWKRCSVWKETLGTTFTRFCTFQVYFYAYNVFLQVGISPAQTRYVSLGVGVTEILTTVLFTEASCKIFNFSFFLQCFFSAGVLCLLPTEIFIQSYRPAAYVFNGASNWIQLFFLGLVFPFIVEGLGSFCFIIFLAYCLSMAIFVFLVVPETKGKTMLQIMEEFNRLNHRGKKGQPALPQNNCSLMIVTRL
uniref:Major facilitator superfamily (MFS) profile domain-containing protein n=1 Tax=Anas platyrhynchos TaxID=8839 RepID=A0A8B9Z983_ANAPL